MPVEHQNETGHRQWKKPHNNLRELKIKGEESKKYEWVVHFNTILEDAFGDTFMVEGWREKSKQIDDSNLESKQNLYDQSKKEVYNKLVEEKYDHYMNFQDKSGVSKPKQTKAERAPLTVAYHKMAQYLFQTMGKDYWENSQPYWDKYEFSQEFRVLFNIVYKTFLPQEKAYNQSTVKFSVQNLNDEEYDIWHIANNMWNYRRRVFHLHWCDNRYKPAPDPKFLLDVSIPIDHNFFNSVCAELGAAYDKKKQQYDMKSSWTYKLPTAYTTRKKCAFLRAVFQKVEEIRASQDDTKLLLNSLYEKVKKNDESGKEENFLLHVIKTTAIPSPNKNPFLVVLE